MDMESKVGIGDEIIASGHALREHDRTQKRVQIIGKDNRVRWSPIWEGLDFIAKPKEVGDFARIVNGPQARPYIKYPFSRTHGQRFTDWKARDHVGRIVIPQAFHEYAREQVGKQVRFVLIEPMLKASSNPNKQWGRDKWIELADVIRHYRLTPLQIGPRDTMRLPGVHFIETPTFFHACAVMALTLWCILPDGGLHHANAAMRLNNATVLWGGAGSCENLGYPIHKNVTNGPPCGRWTPCSHCADIWAKLDPAQVFLYTPRRYFI